MPDVRPRRTWPPLLAVLFLAVLTAACGERTTAVSESAVTSTPAVTPVTVTWSFWGDPWELAVNKRVVRAFERAHPNIRVEIAHHPWSRYFDWLNGEWAAGRSPDVMFLNYIPSYAIRGELQPLNAYMIRDGIGTGDFYPALLDAFRGSDAQLYGLPRDNDTKVIYYNRAHFLEAGIPEPADGWTWADLRAAALALTVRDPAVPRYGFGFETEYWWLAWVWQGGGDVLDDPRSPTRVLLDSPQNAASLQFLQDLIHVDRVTPPPSALNTDDLSRLFRDGRVSMIFGNHTLVPWLTETPGLTWNVAPLPRHVERVNLAGGAGFVLSRRSQQKDAAWELVRFLTGPKAQAILAESGVIVPARRSVREDNIFLRQQPYRADVFVSETELGRPVPNFPGVQALERTMSDGLAPLWRGERRAAEILPELAPRVSQAIGLASP
jgi:multiple sugar transport system substrate-binding protein